MQEDYSGTGTETLLRWVGFFGSFKALVAYLIVCFNVMEKPNSLYIISGTAFVYSVTHIMKSYYKEEPPYLMN